MFAECVVQLLSLCQTRWAIHFYKYVTAGLKCEAYSHWRIIPRDELLVVCKSLRRRTDRLKLMWIRPLLQNQPPRGEMNWKLSSVFLRTASVAYPSRHHWKAAGLMPRTLSIQCHKFNPICVNDVDKLYKKNMASTICPRLLWKSTHR